jgi:glycosyltransferase involved in cell wall biosynthesis
MMFTVFTPTYNRAHTLPRVYESLCKQTCKDFEWLIIDDGSTDNTRELIENYVAGSPAIPVRYYWQPHLGKHIAHNLALEKARGKFFFILDSDDTIMPNALERVAFHCRKIPPMEYFLGVTGLVVNGFGVVCGDKFPGDVFDMSAVERILELGIAGEKQPVIRTDIARQYPFPEIKGTDYIPEGWLWLSLGRKYRERCVNEVFRMRHEDAGRTLTKERNQPQNIRGRRFYAQWFLRNFMGWFFYRPMEFVKAAAVLVMPKARR